MKGAGRTFSCLACASALALVAVSPVPATPIRICDGRHRRVVCHWQGSGGATTLDVPPSETLTYGAPTIAASLGGHIRLVIGNCEIDCFPPNDGP